MRVGFTGHQRLEDESAWSWLEISLTSYLAAVAAPLVGVSSLAIGADQLFASVLLKQGGTLHVVLPFEGYDLTFKSEESQANYFSLLRGASVVETLRGRGDQQESYLAAGKRVVDLADTIIAVWNGKRAVGLGGTGDVVRYAADMGKRIIHLNPTNRQDMVMWDVQ